MEQKLKNGRQSVFFASKPLNTAQQNNIPKDLELLGIVETLQAWPYYLKGRNFVILTDRSPLKHLET